DRGPARHHVRLADRARPRSAGPSGRGVRRPGLPHGRGPHGPVPRNHGGGAAHHVVRTVLAGGIGVPAARAGGVGAVGAGTALSDPAPAEAVLTAERDDESVPAFEVHLANFEGPFDLLLSLIAKHKLDVTEVALSKVTDEFIAYISALARSGAAWNLDETSEFLVVASTLLDLKAARLLPRGEVEDEDDLALLEARDLLFARLLQYKAFKEIAGVLSERFAAESLRFPRAVGLEERFAGLLPEVVV